MQVVYRARLPYSYHMPEVTGVAWYVYNSCVGRSLDSLRRCGRHRSCAHGVSSHDLAEEAGSLCERSVEKLYRWSPNISVCTVIAGRRRGGQHGPEDILVISVPFRYPSYVMSYGFRAFISVASSVAPTSAYSSGGPYSSHPGKVTSGTQFQFPPTIVSTLSLLPRPPNMLTRPIGTAGAYTPAKSNSLPRASTFTRKAVQLHEWDAENSTRSPRSTRPPAKTPSSRGLLRTSTTTTRTTPTPTCPATTSSRKPCTRTTSTHRTRLGWTGLRDWAEGLG